MRKKLRGIVVLLLGPMLHLSKPKNEALKSWRAHVGSITNVHLHLDRGVCCRIISCNPTASLPCGVRHVRNSSQDSFIVVFHHDNDPLT